MWVYQYLRAQELARERMAEADEWRRARSLTRSRAEGKARISVSARGFRRTSPEPEAA